MLFFEKITDALNGIELYEGVIIRRNQISLHNNNDNNSRMDVYVEYYEIMRRRNLKYV